MSKTSMPAVLMMSGLGCGPFINVHVWGKASVPSLLIHWEQPN